MQTSVNYVARPWQPANTGSALHRDQNANADALGVSRVTSSIHAVEFVPGHQWAAPPPFGAFRNVNMVVGDVKSNSPADACTALPHRSGRSGGAKFLPEQGFCRKLKDDRKNRRSNVNTWAFGKGVLSSDRPKEIPTPSSSSSSHMRKMSRDRSNEIYVGNLAIDSVTSGDPADFFKQYGRIRRVNTKENRRFAFVVFADSKAAGDAVDAGHREWIVDRVHNRAEDAPVGGRDFNYKKQYERRRDMPKLSKNDAKSYQNCLYWPEDEDDVPSRFPGPTFGQRNADRLGAALGSFVLLTRGYVKPRSFDERKKSTRGGEHFEEASLKSDSESVYGNDSWWRTVMWLTRNSPWCKGLNARTRPIIDVSEIFECKEEKEKSRKIKRDNGWQFDRDVLMRYIVRLGSGLTLEERSLALFSPSFVKVLSAYLG